MHAQIEKLLDQIQLEDYDMANQACWQLVKIIEQSQLDKTSANIHEQGDNIYLTCNEQYIVVEKIIDLIEKNEIIHIPISIFVIGKTDPAIGIGGLMRLLHNPSLSAKRDSQYQILIALDNFLAWGYTPQIAQEIKRNWPKAFFEIVESSSDEDIHKVLFHVYRELVYGLVNEGEISSNNS